MQTAVSSLGWAWRLWLLWNLWTIKANMYCTSSSSSACSYLLFSLVIIIILLLLQSNCTALISVWTIYILSDWMAVYAMAEPPQSSCTCPVAMVMVHRECSCSLWAIVLICSPMHIIGIGGWLAMIINLPFHTYQYLGFIHGRQCCDFSRNLCSDYLLAI